jgi:ribonuclease-3
MTSPEHSRPDAGGVEERLERAEAIIGVRFADRSILQRALTHPSYSFESGTKEQYERLEFLGDSVLGLIMTDHIYRTFPDFPEGRMAKARASLVSGVTLAEIARHLGLGDALLIGHGAEAGGARRLVSVLADAFEALVGAVYLDRGLDAASAFVMAVFADRLAADAIGATSLDAKSELQELTMAAANEIPEYHIVEEAGPPHERTFTAEVRVAGELLGRGSGPTKKDAEKAAAAEALRALADDDEGGGPHAGTGTEVIG